MTPTRATRLALLSLSLLTASGLAAAAGAADKGKQAAASPKAPPKPVSDDEFAAFLAGGKKGIAMPCKFPDPRKLETQAQAEALVAEGNAWQACLREHDKRRQRWYDFEETSNGGVAARLSGAQIDAYRAQLRVAISDDVNATSPRIKETYGTIGEALQDYEWRSRPDAPAAYYTNIARRLDGYAYDCATPAVPHSLSNNAEVDAWNSDVGDFLACEKAWLAKSRKLNMPKGMEEIISADELNTLSFDQGKRIFDLWMATRGAIDRTHARRSESIPAFEAAVARMKERTEMREAAREADARDRRESAQTAEALRDAIRRAGNAATGNTGNGRFVPVQIPKRPGQP